MPAPFANPEAVMRRALELAVQGRGFVEPNPTVGAVIVDDDLQLIGEGYHERYGGPHAEIQALAQAGSKSAGKTLYVSLEPCCHQGKTGPCTAAIIGAGIRKVVVAMQDPAPHIDGRGIAQLRASGIEVEVGLHASAAARLAAPFAKLVTTGIPWVLAKWAMTLDGKIASRTGSSRWISGERAREIVHQLRGRMDAIVIGAGTAAHDDPRLTTRPPGPRVATRIVVDTNARLSPDSQLVRSLDQAPLLVVARENAPADNVDRLRNRGVEVLQLPPAPGIAPQAGYPDLRCLLEALGQRHMTNVLVEGGGRLLGSLFDRQLIDEAHVFVAPRVVGGADSVTPVAGCGLAEIAAAAVVDQPQVEAAGDDVYIHGALRYARIGT